MMRPLGDRVLIVPDVPPEITDSGLKIIRNWEPITTGTVAAIGEQVREVKVGDDVIFSWQVGQEVSFNEGQSRYIVLREGEIQAVMEGPHDVGRHY